MSFFNRLKDDRPAKVLEESDDEEEDEDADLTPEEKGMWILKYTFFLNNKKMCNVAF